MTKVWLITCNCHALVQALAEAVLASGHNLVVTAIDSGPVIELVERYGDQLRVVPVEVTDGAAVETAIQATLGAFGRVDVLVLDLAKWHSRVSYKGRGPERRSGPIPMTSPTKGSPSTAARSLIPR